MTIRLHVNIDHVATVRNARGVRWPDPVLAAHVCEAAGADGITVHLREDRRHIRDDDVMRLKAAVTTLLNLEMAATNEMIGIAERVRPDVITLVPERREERTTEGGLDVRGQICLDLGASTGGHLRQLRDNRTTAAVVAVQGPDRPRMADRREGPAAVAAGAPRHHMPG